MGGKSLELPTVQQLIHKDLNDKLEILLTNNAQVTRLNEWNRAEAHSMRVYNEYMDQQMAAKYPRYNVYKMKRGRFKSS